MLEVLVILRMEYILFCEKHSNQFLLKYFGHLSSTKGGDNYEEYFVVTGSAVTVMMLVLKSRE